MHRWRAAAQNSWLRQIAWSWVKATLWALSISQLWLFYRASGIVILLVASRTFLTESYQLLVWTNLIRCSWPQRIRRCYAKRALWGLKIFHTTVGECCSRKTMRGWPWVIIGNYLSWDWLFDFLRFKAAFHEVESALNSLLIKRKHFLCKELMDLRNSFHIFCLLFKLWPSFIKNIFLAWVLQIVSPLRLRVRPIDCTLSSTHIFFLFEHTCIEFRGFSSTHIAEYTLPHNCLGGINWRLWG